MNNSYYDFQFSAEDFRTQMERLEQTFGEKAFNKHRLALIQRTLYGLPFDSLRKIIDHMISSFRYAPLPKDFKEAASKERAALPKPKSDEVRVMTFDCDTCLDCGFNAVRADGKYYFVRCRCDLGRATEFGFIPQWEMEYGRSMDLVPMRDIHGAWIPDGTEENDILQKADKWSATKKKSDHFWHNYFAKESQ